MWYNAILAWVLKSRFHPLLSKNILLLAYRGRRSGKIYETPVNYVNLTNELLITSLRQRKWWRNFIGGAPVRVRLAGKVIDGQATALVDIPQVSHYLDAYLTAAPQVAKYFKVSLDTQGHPLSGNIQAAAQERVVIRIPIRLS